LHDLNVLHDGSDLTGPLRIHLRSAIPRFILRYRLLQEQISRLDLAAGADENVTAEGLYSFLTMSHLFLNVTVGYVSAVQHDAVPEADHHEEEAQLDADHHEAEARHEALLHDQKDPDRAESAQEPNVPPDQLRGDDALAKDLAFTPQAVADVVYHSVSGDIIQALEEEDNYEGKNVSTEYPEDGDGDHDTAAAHQTSEIDPAETVPNANVEFGGEETEYQDYMQPGEYGDIYEDFPEEDSTHTEFGFDQTVGYDESRTEAVSSTVEESQAGLPESDLHEEDTTPVPPAQQIDSEPARRSETKDSVSDGE
jgi:hypothetical protein